MNRIVSSLLRFWPSYDLGKFRPSENTYTPFLLGENPPLHHEFNGDFSWLGVDAKDKGDTKELDALQKKLKCTFPKDFYTFWSHPEWKAKLPKSPTDCEYAELAAAPFLDGVLLPIYWDSQGVVLWYLYVESTAKNCTDSVVVAAFGLRFAQVLKRKENMMRVTIVSTSETFESFLYRICLESHAYFQVTNGKKPPKEWEKAVNEYLSFYDETKWKDLKGAPPEIVARYGKLSDADIEKGADSLPWAQLCRYQKLSEKVMLKFADRLDWTAVSRFQAVTPAILRAHGEDVDWQSISIYQKLDDDMIREFQGSLDWRLMYYNNKLSDAIKKEFKKKLPKE